MKRTLEKTKKINFTEKGITLIALVITIIILLILAGVISRGRKTRTRCNWRNNKRNGKNIDRL